MNAAPLAPAIDASTALSLQVVTDADSLRGLAPAWQDLLEQSAAPNPMSAPDWLLTWWDVYGQNRELCTGFFYDGEQLVGLAPLCRRRFWHRPGIPFRRIEYLGSDVDENDGVASDYLNLIALPGYEERVAHDFCRALHQGAFGAWDECVLSAMDGANPITSLLGRASEHPRARVEATPTVAAPYLALPASWDDYLRALPKKKRRGIKFALETFHAWAGADWQVHIADTPEQRAQGMAILTDLHNRRWEAAHQDGAFAAPRFRAFHERTTRQALAQGQLLLLWISVRGAAVAALYALVANQKVYFYQCGRTLEAPANLQLGIVLVSLTIQEALRRGLDEFDFLAGEATYKSLFTPTARTLWQVRVARPGLSETALRGARTALHWVRSVRRGAGVVAGKIRHVFSEIVN